MVEGSFLVMWVVGAPIQLFLVPASASRLVKQKPWLLLLLIGKSSPRIGGIVGSIFHGGLIELFLVPASAPRLV